MNLTEQLTYFSQLDVIAVALLIALWAGIGHLVEHPPKRRPSVSMTMAKYRHEWMQQFVLREPRILDGALVSMLRQGTTFFASATMLAIGGGLALIGNADQLNAVAQDLRFGNAPVIVWEIKIILALIFASIAFLKFVWAHRLFGYAAVLMGAVPVDPEHELTQTRAVQAADLHVAAARNFTRGLRAVYMGLTATAWLIGAEALLIAAIFTSIVILRREFASASRQTLLLGNKT